MSDDNGADNVNTALETSNLRTRIHTLTLTCERKIYYVDGVETAIETIATRI